MKGKSSYLDEARDAFAMALFALGKDPNTLDDDDLDAAKKYLIDLKKKIKSITSDYQDPLKSGELILSQAYSGDVFTIQADNDEHRVRHPDVGRVLVGRLDGDPEGRAAQGQRRAFMNYILEPKVGAALTNCDATTAARTRRRRRSSTRTILDNPLIYPPADVLAKLPFQKDLGEDEIKYADRWTEVKSA